MEADRSFQHFCKLCNKSFRCGRSLGGHMRSHLMNAESEFKLRGLNNGGRNSDKMKIVDSSACSGYGLRENPKRNSKHSNQDSESLIRGKFCRECGKEFQSWKALFGHMKCHAEKEKTSIKIEDQESWSFVGQKQLLMINDSHSDNEFSAPSRKRRSSRRTIRPPKPATSSSFSIANASSSASEIDQEQEEIALCLIMLSRDNWGRVCSIAESSENISTFSENPPELGDMDSGDRCFSGKQKDFKKTSNVGSKRLKTSKIHHPDSENCKISQKRSKFECSSCRKIFRSYQALGGHKASHRKMKSCFDSTMEVAENSIEAENENQIDPETRNKRKMHECPICFKLFSSGQALGGHKRSHLFGCSENTLRRKIPDFIDLNLPAPAEEEIDNLVVHPWWVKSFYENEKLLSLISNGASL